MGYHPNYLNVVDLEATCWEDDIRPADQDQEIIEIGLAVVDTESREIDETASYLIRPVCSEVTEFCTDLTSLTSDQLEDNGRTLQEVCQELRSKHNTHQHPWASWGLWDLYRLKDDCKMKNVRYPMNANHFNIKSLFAMVTGRGREVGLDQAVDSTLGDFDGRHHRGVDDALNTAKLFLDLFH